MSKTTDPRRFGGVGRVFGEEASQKIFNSHVTVVGMGGVSTAEDVVEMMMAGATAVEIGAQNLVNPYACRDIIDELPSVLDKYRINNISDIIGVVE